MAQNWAVSGHAGRNRILVRGVPDESYFALSRTGRMGYNHRRFLRPNEIPQTNKVATMYRSTRGSPAPAIEPRDVVPMPDRSEVLSSLEAVRRKVREIGDEYVDAVLQLITECALSLTGASGAALAFLTDDKMICWARAGEPAPPLGASVDVKQGLSAECVRSGLLVSCEDTENDPRIDREVSRALGIGSLMAVPILSNFRVVGLLEIFFPHPRAFTKAHETILDRLVEMIPKTRLEKTQPENTQPETPVGPQAVSRPPASELGLMESGSNELGSIHATRDSLWKQKPEIPEQVPQQAPEPVREPAPTARFHLFHWALLGLAVALVAMVIGYLVGSMIEKH